MKTEFEFFVTTAKSLSELAARELRDLGIATGSVMPAGVSFSGSLEQAYRACLWSRVASRVLLPLAHFPATDAEQLYAGVQTIDWSEHLGPADTLAVDAHVRSSGLTHSHFVALKTKDAIVDQFAEREGTRPSVELARPSVRINVHVQHDQVTLSLDLSGDSLHRRAYRQDGGKAPLKENLAAAILYRAGWPEICLAGGDLLDPMCGSGTLVIEGALMAADIAPGLRREYFGFGGWRQHDAAAWQALLDEARTRRNTGLASSLPRITGYDHDGAAVQAALRNVEQAGLSGVVHIERRDINAAHPPRINPQPGLLVVNPPYGERLGEAEQLPALYRQIGGVCKEHFSGWHAALLTGNPELGYETGLRSQRPATFYNGALECKLLVFEISEANYLTPRSQLDSLDYLLQQGKADSEGARMLANRLRKNQKNLSRWLRKEEVSCYRLYDADLPEYAVAVDVYETTAGRRVHVAEYQAPDTVDPKAARQRLADALAAIQEVLEIPADALFLKVRSRQKGKSQYEKQAEGGKFFEVSEGPCRFRVNFSDYLDTGLFLDHRITRRMLHDEVRDKRFLNLFAYTGTASVYAALGGACSTTTVDMSATYLDWARRNFALNGIKGEAYQFIQQDCFTWLREQAERPWSKPQYDVIFLDPPTFSISKRMDGSFDVQRDHVGLISLAMRLLSSGGVLVFSCNRRDFRLNEEELSPFMVHNISRQTIPEDYARDPRVHSVWRIRHDGGRSNG